MFTNLANLGSTKKIAASTKTGHFARMFFLAMIVALAVAMTTGFVWIQMDQVIAPPGLRLMDWLWRMFICNCAA